jgi:microcystin degradation protein MlrC
MQHFLSAFDSIVGSVILVDTPGLLSTDFANITFKNRSNVFWPRTEIAHLTHEI